MIDEDLLEDLTPPGVPSPGQVLSDLLVDNDLIDLYRYADQGPPPDVEPIGPETLGADFPPAYDGWVVLNSWDRLTGHGSVSYSLGGSPAFSLLMLPRIGLAEGDDAGGYEALHPEVAKQRRVFDQLATDVADQGLHADLFVTRREYLLTERARRTNPDVTILEPEAALPLVGLFLRDKQRYLPLRRVSFTASLFYWVATRELLPSGWRWFGAVVAHEADSDDHSLTYLAQSAFQRVARSIEARDRVAIAMNRGPQREHMEDALSNVDTMLLFLMGAVDATARLAHRVLQLPLDEYQSGWQKDSWLRTVERSAKQLADVITQSTRRESTLTILRILRNSIHGEALQGLTHQDARETKALVGLPERDVDRLLQAIESCGGRESWGIQEVGPLGTYADPAVLADNVFQLSIELIDDIMGATPVERLDGVDIAYVQELPPSTPQGQPPGAFDATFRKAIRYQLGVYE